MTRSFRIARIAGIDIKVHWSFVLAILYVVQLMRPGTLGGFAFAMLLLVLLFACVTLHELGHSLVSIRLGTPVYSIVLWPLGGFAVLSRQPRKHWQEIAIAAAGPFVNLVIAAIAFVLWFVSMRFGNVSQEGWEGYFTLVVGTWRLLEFLIVVNLSLAFFNLIPAYPLDGGRILRAALASVAGEGRANGVMLGLSWLLAVGLGVYALVQRDVMLAIVAVLVFVSAGSLHKRFETVVNTGLGYLFDRGYVLIQQGRLDQAIAYYDRAVQRRPKRALSYNNRGYAYALQKRYAEAMPNYDHALKLKPDLVIAYLNRAAAYRALGDRTRALADYSALIEQYPQYAAGYHYRGHAYLSVRDYDRALADFNRAVELEPTTAAMYVSRGLCFMERGSLGSIDMDLAMRDFERAVELAPNEAIVFNNRGYLRFLLGDTAQASVDYKHAIRLDPKLSEAYTGLGEIHEQHQQYGEALLNYTQAVTFKPQSVVAHLLRSRLYHILNDHQQGHADLERALEIDVEETLLRSPLWLSAYVRGHLDWARSCCDQALERHPDDWRVFFGRAEAHRANNQDKAALADYMQALQRSPQNAEVIFGQGRAYLALGMNAEAGEAFQTVIATSDNHYIRRLAKEALSHLEGSGA